MHSYALRRLADQLQQPAIDFAARLRRFAARGGARVLSVCAGTAQIESAMCWSLPQSAQVDLTLVDMNPALLDDARATFPPNVSLHFSAQDANKLALSPGAFDVVIFVSGVHHLIELEHVWGQVSQSLRRGGELWLIGEQVGPNGNRLSGATLEAANAAFRSLPPKYRVNAYTGTIDEVLPNKDCAEATFEGIRSSEVLATLYRRFVPAELHLRNCFLWMLVNQTYFSNYDLSRQEDIEALNRLVGLEVEHFLDGGQPTELNGVFRSLQDAS